MLSKTLGSALGGARGNDYEAHCSAINECTRRGATCEVLQRELDLRHALAVQRFAKAKSTDAVAALWRDESFGSDPAGALWAGLTHLRCDGALRERICSDIHMLQHQLGAGNRADLQRLRALNAEHAALKRELAATQERSARAIAEREAQMDSQSTLLLRQRAEAVQKDNVIAALHAPTPPIDDEPIGAQAEAPTEAPGDDEPARLTSLRDTSVLCVGGRTSAAPAPGRRSRATATATCKARRSTRSPAKSGPMSTARKVATNSTSPNAARTTAGR